MRTTWIVQFRALSLAECETKKRRPFLGKSGIPSNFAHNSKGILMNVGILTLTYKSNLNYGAVIQAWALKKTVEKYFGENVVILPMEPELYRTIRRKYSKRTGLLSCIRKKYALFRKNRKLQKLDEYYRSYDRCHRFQSFLHEFAFNGRDIFYPEQIEREISGIDALIIGSDWVWYIPDSQLNVNPSDLPRERAIYLGFTPNQNAPFPRRIAYAASQGIVPSIPSTLWKKALQNFSAVSVREEESVRYLTENGTPLPIEHVVDPTLLLEAEDFGSVETDVSSYIPKDGYILVYRLGMGNRSDPLPDYARRLSERTGLPICNVSTRADAPMIQEDPLGDRIGPREFLSLIRQSRYVVTNSFHGMVFASLYHRPFTAFQRQANDYRQLNLVRLLGFENRLLPNENRDLVGTELDPFGMEPDWERADQARRAAAARSIDFLKRSLGHGHTSH